MKDGLIQLRMSNAIKLYELILEKVRNKITLESLRKIELDGLKAGVNIIANEEGALLCEPFIVDYLKEKDGEAPLVKAGKPEGYEDGTFFYLNVKDDKIRIIRLDSKLRFDRLEHLLN
jgi:hypothetical protein